MTQNKTIPLQKMLGLTFFDEKTILKDFKRTDKETLEEAAQDYLRLPEHGWQPYDRTEEIQPDNYLPF